MVSLLAVSNVLDFANSVSHKVIIVIVLRKIEHLFRLYTKLSYSQNTTFVESVGITPLPKIAANLIQIARIQLMGLSAG